MEQNTKSSSQLYSPQLECSPAIMWLVAIVVDSANIHTAIIPESSGSTAYVLVIYLEGSVT